MRIGCCIVSRRCFGCGKTIAVNAYGSIHYCPDCRHDRAVEDERERQRAELDALRDEILDPAPENGGTDG